MRKRLAAVAINSAASAATAAATGLATGLAATLATASGITTRSRSARLSSSSSTSNLTSLPDELLVHIFRCSTPKSRLELAAVAVRIRELTLQAADVTSLFHLVVHAFLTMGSDSFCARMLRLQRTLQAGFHSQLWIWPKSPSGIAVEDNFEVLLADPVDPATPFAPLSGIQIFQSRSSIKVIPETDSRRCTVKLTFPAGGFMLVHATFVGSHSLRSWPLGARPRDDSKGVVCWVESYHRVAIVLGPARV